VSRRALLFFRWGVFAAACAFLYLRLSRDQGMHAPWAGWSGPGDKVAWAVVFLVVAMMGLNWAIEARKWQVLMRPIQGLSMLRAFTGTVAGTSIGLITPNRVGEFAGRVLFLEPEHRVPGSFATLLGSIAQFVVTLLVGGVFLMFGRPAFLGEAGWPLTWTAVTWSALLIGCAAVFLYFSPGAFARLLLAVPLLRRFERHAHVLDTYERPVLLHVFVLSLVRYAVFTLQFALLLKAMAGVDMVVALEAVPAVFLVTTLVPTTALTELGIRGSVAATFIPGDVTGIVAATALLWLINIVFPALVGSVILLVVRINTSNREP
jgi:hypothetical protein